MLPLGMPHRRAYSGCTQLSGKPAFSCCIRWRTSLDMKEPRLLQDIKNQDQSLAHVLAHQLGDGKAALWEAATLLHHARKIIVTGMGASLYASWHLQYQLAAQGLNCMVADSGELLHYQQQLCADAVVILVSRSGETVELVKLLPQIKNIANCTIAVTNSPDSTLARTADRMLVIGSFEDEGMAIQSYTGTLLALTVLGGAIAGNLDRAHDELQEVLGTISTLLRGGLDSSGVWDGFFEPARPIFLLGRGPSYASALEGGLLLNETAKQPATGMTCGNFRHGAIEFVDPEFRGIVFAPQGRTRQLDLALARSLKDFGGKAIVIGPQEEEASLRFINVPTLEKFAPLMEIIPVQFGAFYLAKAKNVPLGTFRYIAQVTSDEVAF
jgi:glutamine---fructose-6-phosphate transaminase (isomerizing)